MPLVLKKIVFWLLFLFGFYAVGRVYFIFKTMEMPGPDKKSLNFIIAVLFAVFFYFLFTLGLKLDTVSNAPFDYW